MRSKLFHILRAYCGCLMAMSTCFAQEQSASCDACHAPQHEELLTSVHGRLGCAECHGGEKTYSIGADVLKRFIREAPGKRGDFDHGSSFTGKVSRGEVPQRCGSCHANIERMNPYGIPTDQLARYWTSGHGRTLAEKQDDRVAVCTDCHGSHTVLPSSNPNSHTHPTNVPGVCATCHANQALMGEFGLATEIVDEYKQSVHGQLLLEQGDTGAPTCATCHGNHSATPPGFAEVGAVCGQCHEHATKNFETSIHAQQTEHKGCVQCHGGGEDRHFHLIERITKPTGVLIQRYAHLMSTQPQATPEQITEAIHPDPKKITMNAIATCTDCHEELEDDESLPKLFALLDDIAAAERLWVETAQRLDEIGRGVLPVEHARFRFEDARTHLIELAPLQHTLDNELVQAKVAELREVCDEVNTELDELTKRLTWRYKLLAPIWGFAVLFSFALYVRYKRLKAEYVKPLPRSEKWT